MVRSAVWPVGKEKAERLRHFQQWSYLSENKFAARKHEVSSYWVDAVGKIHSIVGENTVRVDSMSHYVGPTQIEELRNNKDERNRRLSRRTITHAGKMGKYVPGAFWKIFWDPVVVLARAVLRSYDVANTVRADELAKEAFFEIYDSKSSAIMTLRDLKKVRVLAEQSESSMWMILYISTVINTLTPYIEDFKVSKIMEVGPGWGILAISLHQLCRCRFILIDLPEVLAATFSVISYYCPDSVVVLPHEVEGMKDNIESADFILLCPEQASLIPSESVDLAINTSSFQEMNYPLIEGYFRLVRRCLRDKGLFYCLNERVFTRNTAEGPIEFEKYP